ncbi:MAG: hypothetical protein Q7U80_08105, partial [Thiobacillus sp.]|nr:hypothetical protein [Thiobacillus sp.]
LEQGLLYMRLGTDAVGAKKRPARRRAKDARERNRSVCPATCVAGHTPKLSGLISHYQFDA